MDENEQATASELPEMGQPEGKSKYPKTMKRGPLAGQTFQTDGEYKAAMREAHSNGVPKRGRRKTNAAKPVKRGGGTYRLQVDLDGQKIVAEGRVTQAQLIEMLRLVTPKA